MTLCWATFSAFYALLSSHMTNKDDDDEKADLAEWGLTNIGVRHSEKQLFSGSLWTFFVHPCPLLYPQQCITAYSER